MAIICARVDLMFLICHMTSRDYVTKVSYNLKDKSPSFLVTTLPSLLVIGIVEEEI